MAWDFTMEKCQELCQSLLSSGYQPCTVFDFLTKGENLRLPRAIFRHDVDRKCENALRMAEIEAELDIIATYYFRYPSTFDINVIGQINEMGHEIGYHYEVLSKAKGDYQKAIRLFELELAAFREKTGCEIKTICMHGSPLSRHNNRNLWNRYHFHRFGISGEAFLSMTKKDVLYLTDTGRNWNGKHNLRDAMPSGYRQTSLPWIDSTDTLMRWISSCSEEILYLTIHPERWALDNRMEWVTEYGKDLLMNGGKWGINLLRKMGK